MGFVIFSFLLIGLCLINFRRYKWWSTIFACILLLQMLSQTILRTTKNDLLWKICSGTIMLMFLPSMVFFIVAVCRDWRRWLTVSLLSMVLTILWFYDYIPNVAL